MQQDVDLVVCECCHMVDRRSLIAPCAVHPGMKMHMPCWRKLQCQCPLCESETEVLPSSDALVQIAAVTRRSVELLLVACSLVQLMHNHFYLMCIVAYVASYHMPRLRQTERCVVVVLLVIVTARIMWATISTALYMYPFIELIEYTRTILH